MKLNLSPTQLERFYEIAYYETYKQMRFKIPNEKFFLFLESFCRVFSIDYTSIVITNSQFLARLKPTKQELVLFGVLTNTKLNTLGMDYRTIRTYKKQVEQGKIAMIPRILNRFIRDDLRKFVYHYYRLFPESAVYIADFANAGGFEKQVEDDQSYEEE